MNLVKHRTDPARHRAQVVVNAATLDAVDRRRNIMLLGGAAAVVFGLLAGFSSEDGPVLCPFRRCTGGYCPGCGLTRSGGRLLRGDVAGSFQQHPYLVLAVGQLALFGAVFSVATDALRVHMKRWARPIMYANVGLIFAIWTARLVGGSIPIPFVG